ncbi:MAG: tripartite tricarboxylate transporter substrate binding protein [Xanthobacteraceae bacterium]
MRALLAVVAVLLISTPVFSQDYPNRPIRFVTFGAAGTASDVLVRAIGKRLSEKLGQPVIVDNKPGADGLIAGGDVAKSAPDGHTLFFASNSPIAAVPALRKSIPYDPMKDFTPITMVGYYTFFLYANPNVPARTLGELIAYAKANPGKLSYGSGNTTGSVGASQIATMAGIKMVHVPYKGEPQAMVDLLAGRIDLMIATLTTGSATSTPASCAPLVTTLKERYPGLPTFRPSMRQACLNTRSLHGRDVRAGEHAEGRRRPPK